MSKMTLNNNNIKITFVFWRIRNSINYSIPCLALKPNWKEGSILFENICEDIRLGISLSQIFEKVRLIGLHTKLEYIVGCPTWQTQLFVRISIVLENMKVKQLYCKYKLQVL